MGFTNKLHLIEKSFYVQKMDVLKIEIPFRNGKKVKIEPLSNYCEILKHGVSGLEVENGDKVLHREVLLKGVQSNAIYATARSTVSLKYLPDDISRALEKGEIGIGELLREKGVETYRDIYDINYYSFNLI